MIITRDQGQSMVVEQYKRHRALACFYCTGFGKGKAALDAIRTHGYSPDDPSWSGLIIAHSQGGRDRIWPDQIAEWAPEYVKCIGRQITIICYQSLKNHVLSVFDWMIGDEFHYVTEDYYKHLGSMKFGGVLLLTATEPDDPGKKKIMQKLAKGHRLTIKLDMAVNSNVLNDYRIRVWNVYMDMDDRSEYLRHCKKFTMFKEKGIFGMLNKVAGERARFLYTCNTKYWAACYLRDMIRAKGKRFVMHCGSIEMANKLSPYRYHSQVDDTDYNRFLKMQISEIASIKQIREGENIPRLESSLIVQASSKEAHMVQNIGRNMRLDPGEVALIHVLQAKDTVDEDWVRESLKPFNKLKISYHDIEPDKYEKYR